MNIKTEHDEELLSTFIEIEPLNNDEFLKVKETLTRIGIASRTQGEDKPTLWQSCHILHKRGKYYACHFKQLFLLDGRDKRTNLSEEDINRAELIANMLQSWGLIKIKEEYPFNTNVKVVVIPYKEKSNWNLRSKYTIGKKHNYGDKN